MIDNDISSMYPAVFNALPNRYDFWKQLDEEHRMRVLNKKYWPYQIKVADNFNSGDAERWCYENFASRGWRNVGAYFAFKNGAEATAFSLKWL